MALTLRQFIIAAVAQGCEEKLARHEIPGWISPVTGHYLAKGNVRALLPDIRDSDLLTPTMLANLVRALDLHGIDGT